MLKKCKADNKIRNNNGELPWEVAAEALDNEHHHNYAEIVNTLQTYDAAAEMRHVAEYLDINVENESHLMWIAQDFIDTPLPDGWLEAADENGTSYYYNLLTGESSWAHPYFEMFANEVIKQRRAYDCMSIAQKFGPKAFKKRYFKRWAKDFMKRVWREKWGEAKAIAYLRKKMFLMPYFIQLIYIPQIQN